MSAEKIISEWGKKKFKSLYWLEGEEEYYIDQVVDYANRKGMTVEDVERWLRPVLEYDA